MFTKATKARAKLRLGLIGPSGSGKTFTALLIAQELGGRVAVLDTEHGSASKYAGKFEFDTLEPDMFSPTVYTEAIRAAEAAGYDVLVIDSLSHAWSGKGGALEMVDNAAKRTGNNSFTAWRDVTPLHNELIDAIVGARLHVIATMRSKVEYIIEDQGGKKVPRKVGLAPVQREGMEYEFDVVGDLDDQHTFVVSKTRCEALDKAVIREPGHELAETLRAWLSDGVEAHAEAPSAPKEPTGDNGGTTTPDEPDPQAQALKARVQQALADWAEKGRDDLVARTKERLAGYRRPIVRLSDREREDLDVFLDVIGHEDAESEVPDLMAEELAETSA